MPIKKNTLQGSQLIVPEKHEQEDKEDVVEVDDQTKLENHCLDILNRYHFDLTQNKKLLEDQMEKELTDKYKVYVYILACYNLTAVDSVLENVKERLAGNVALCSADPFPIVRLGHKNTPFSTEKHIGLDLISDKDNAIEKDLSPVFFRQYELEA